MFQRKFRGRTLFIYEDEVERFHGYCVASEGCWGWTGDTTTGSRPRIHLGGVQMYGSVASYLIHKGDIPEGMEVCHSCDNSACPNPEHLELGTHKQNMAQMAQRGRSFRGNPGGFTSEAVSKGWVTRRAKYGESGHK